MFGERYLCKTSRRTEEACRFRHTAFLGNDECGCNYADNTYPFRQDSTFLYYFGLLYDGLAALIDIDNDQEIYSATNLPSTMSCGCELSPLSTRKHISSESTMCVRRPISKAGSTVSLQIRYLPVYRAEHRLKLWRLLGIMPGEEKPFGRIHPCRSRYAQSQAAQRNSRD